MWAGGVEREGPPRLSLTHTQQAAEVLDWGLGEIWKSSMSLGWQNHWLYAGLSDGTENREHEGLWDRAPGVEEPEKNTQQLRFPLTLRFLAPPPLAA